MFPSACSIGISASGGVTMMLTYKTLMSIVMIAMTLLAPKCGPQTEWPEGLPHGEIVLPNIEDPDTPGAYFDLSAGEIVYGEEGRARGDVYLEKTFISPNPALGVGIYDQQPDSLLYDTTAPSWGDRLWKLAPDATTPGRISIYEGHNIWVRTAEGNTGKFKILQAESNEDYSSFNWIRIQWIYQPDGTEELASHGTATDDTGATTTE
jgi:hypothetical protein